MNWEVAKSWLIALFVILDSILGWQLYESHVVSNGYTESPADLLANTKTLLANHGFSLDTDVPSGQPALPTFQATLAKPNFASIGSIAFPGATGKSTVAGAVGLTTNEGTLTMTGLGSWDVTYMVPQKISSSRTVLSYVYHGNEYALDEATSGNGHFVYYKRTDNYPVFDVEVVASETSGQLQTYSQTYIDHVVNNSPPKPVITALDALDSLVNTVDRVDVSTRTDVVQVDLGYARKVQVNEENNSSPSKNYWFPVWRIVTSEGTYFVNAFTGEVEMETGF